MDPRLTPAVVSLLALGLGALTACSDPADEPEDVVPDSHYGTKGLDTLAPPDAEPQAPVPDEPAPAEQPVVIDQGGDGEQGTEEEREWVRERQSQSMYGKARDRAKEVGNDMQGGTQATEGLADTAPEDEWVGAGGVVWEMPEDWRMAMPAGDRIGEMFVPSQLGGASVAFTRETADIDELERRAGAILVTPMGGRISPRTESFELLGRPVRTLALEGTFIDPSAKGSTNEKPFYAVRAAVIDLGEQRVLIVFWGPEGTVTQNEGKFEAMIRGMKEE